MYASTLRFFVLLRTFVHLFILCIYLFTFSVYIRQCSSTCSVANPSFTYIVPTFYIHLENQQ